MRNPFKTFSFQTTFFTSFIIISILIISLLGITSYYITNQEVVEQTISSRRLLLNEINKQIDVQFESIEYDSLTLASNPKLSNYLQENEDSYERIEQNSEIVGLLSRLSYVKEGVHSVQLYAKNSTMNVQISGNGVYDYNIVKESSWYNEIQDADYCWVGTHKIEIDSYAPDDRMVVSFARKILSQTGKEVGILVINIKMSFVKKIGSSGDLNASRLILDTHNRLVTEFNESTKNAASYANMKSQISKMLDESEADKFAIVRGEEKNLIIWNQQDKTHWITMDIIPWEDITKGSRRIEKVILLAVIVCILLATMMAYLLSRQFVVPIRRLIHAMNLMKIGKLDVQIPNDYMNEFGHLNDNFNQMTQRIDHLIIQVNDENQRKREAEIRILQEQINPHFLYNTLDMMNWHAIELGVHDISRMLSLLGKMLRIGLSSGAAFITVQREYEHLQCYVELQKIRYKQKFKFSMSIPESMKSYYIPKLIIQPFVENSLIHGLHMRDEGFVRISGREDGQNIYLMIEDNGDGMAPEAAFQGREHNGIRNVHERIQLYFGDMYGVQISSEAAMGTKILVTMPKVLSEPTKRAEENEND